MSLTKREIEKRDELSKTAREVLARLGVIEESDIYNYYSRKKELTNDIYALATNIVKKEKKVDDADLKEFHSFLKVIYEESGIESVQEFENAMLDRK